MHDSSPAKLIVPRILLNANNRDIVITTPVSSKPLGSYVVIKLDGATGGISAGGNGVDGDLALFPRGFKSSNPANNKGKATIHMKAGDAAVQFGAKGFSGQLRLVSEGGAAFAELQQVKADGTASFSLGGHGLHGKITVLDSNDKSQIVIDGMAGDILLGAADCAEEFDIISDKRVEPGAVMVLDAEGRLRLSDRAYDPRVAGVLSGAGAFKPGIILDRKVSSRPRAALAVIGKVYCKVDANRQPIGAGDLLTTSAVPGHAMRASDRRRAFGAVIGKALASLRAGQGLIPVLVALQ